MTGALDTHLQTGLTSVCRCWKITRRDGVCIGFTDHDADISFDDTLFQAGSGLSPSALSQASGLAVDNTEAIGALDADTLSEASIAAGLFDGAEVVAYLVNWANVAERETQFRGHLGEITRAGGQFKAEVRGLTDALNQSRGRVFQKPCSAVLGDKACAFDASQTGFTVDGVVSEALTDRQFVVQVDGTYPERWFERGVLRLAAQKGQSISIKRDDIQGTNRSVTLWMGSKIAIKVGDAVQLVAGCDRQFKTCQNKFQNVKNFQGFPDLPGEDWVMKLPSQGQIHDGGSRR